MSLRITPSKLEEFLTIAQTQDRDCETFLSSISKQEKRELVAILSYGRSGLAIGNFEEARDVARTEAHLDFKIPEIASATYLIRGLCRIAEEIA